MKLGLGQIKTTWFSINENKESCIRLIKEAKNKSCTLIAFPEMTLTGFSSDISAIENFITFEETLSFFKKAAEENSIYIGFGAVEKMGAKNFNSYIIISPKGLIANKYYKIHPFSPGKEDVMISPGDNISFSVIDNIVLSSFICYDLRFPEIFQIASKKSQLLLVASAWPQSRRDHWLTLLKARAIENQCFVAGVNSYGYDLSNQYYSGDSIIVSPLGETLSLTSEREDLITAEISSSLVKSTRAGFNVNKDRKNSTYLKYYKQFI
ncbi:nitrilase-related carbon-nitrogen hydrolase [Clostridium polynesiense]|uniref:nitrilase-related carbon-nitrogen hydrolase n=1 Tax=Clostridium polynesiense TaxID=1325933 RepID=UPI00058DA0ED|nr:nitrilase-related carbon-nitrogen hydrolase [Clostridium polynesiense]